MTANRIERWTGSMLVFLAIGSFILSFAGMYAVAVDSGYGLLAWLWPLVTESAVVIFSLVLLTAKLEGYKNNALQPMIVTCTVLSVVFNVLHAPNDQWLTKAVVAFPPIFLYAAFKTWIWKVEQDTKRAGLVKTMTDLVTEIDTVNGELQDKVSELDKLTGQIETLKAERDALKGDISETFPRNVQKMTDLTAKRQTQAADRKQQALHMLSEGLSIGDIANNLDVTERTVKRYLNGSLLQ
ncbi:MAG: DUF2637 domain-containing protein [Anaerolineae bacterium]|nr:DUF2637 domain-containing protein [Anaerolineae bacterium]